MLHPTPTLVLAAFLGGAATDDAPVVRWVDRSVRAAAPPVQATPVDLSVARSPTQPTSTLHTAALIDVEVEDADIRSVLRLFSATAGLNFVVPDTVQSTVTVHLKAVPWDLALAAILSALDGRGQVLANAA